MQSIDTELVTAAIQAIGGLLLLITMGVVGWALKQIVGLKVSAAVQDTKTEDIERRLDEYLENISTINDKLDRLIEQSGAG